MPRTRCSSRVRKPWAAALGLTLGVLSACGGGVTAPSGPADNPTLGVGSGTAAGEGLIPVNVRKLTSAEFDAAVNDLLGLDTGLSGRLWADQRNVYFTSSALERMDATRTAKLQTVARELAQRAVNERFDDVVGCDPGRGAACAKEFIERFATRAFRRPVVAEERKALLTVFETASKDGIFVDGVLAVIEAVLQSASFLYVPAIGSEGERGRVLTSYEIASLLSFLTLGAPPDDALREAAAKDELGTSEQRVAQFRRLVRDDARARRQVRRFIREWLGIDHLSDVDRFVPEVDLTDTVTRFAAEADAFIDEVMFEGDGSLATLITADFTMADTTLVSYYGLAGSAPADRYVRTALGDAKRRGILMQGAFLTAHAGRDHSSPVKRGVAVMRRLLCKDIAFPTGDLAAAAMQVPPPSPDATTRERFTAHSLNPACNGCHSQIDPLGFAFESFDNVGRFRETENGKPVDTSGDLEIGDVSGEFQSGLDLVKMLSESDDVHRCFARNLFRFASTVYAEDVESRFLQIWDELPAESRGNVLEVMAAFVASDLFATRSTP